MNFLVQRYGEKWTVRNIVRRVRGRKPILKRKKPKVGYFPLPDGKIVSFEEYVQEMGETPDLLEVRPPGWDENKEERRVNKRTRNQLFGTIYFSSFAFFLFSYGYNQISLMQNYLHESQFFMQIKYMPDYYNTYGHVQLLAKYCLAGVTAVFVPYLIRTFQDKWILFVATGTYGIFVSLGFLDAKYTIMPSGFVAGFSCMPFFVTYSMYMVHIAQRLGDLNKKRPYNGIQSNWLLYKFNTLSFIAWFFGFTFSAGTCSYLFYDVLERNNTYISTTNLTCGRMYCDTEWPNWWDKIMFQPNIPTIDKYAYTNMVNATFLIIAMAMFLFGCMEGQTAKNWSHFKDDKGFELNFKLGWKAIFSWKRTLLAPIFIFTGWSTDFIAYSYTRAYPICSLDGWSFFLSLSSFGFMAAIVSCICPWLARRKTGWNPILIVGAFCFISAILLLIFWIPVTSLVAPNLPPQKPPLIEHIAFYAIPGLWGIGAGTLHSAINIKIEFEYPDPDEMVSMFALYHHWRAIGVVIGYLSRSTATCTAVKLYALLSTLVIGIVLYICYERRRLNSDPKAVKADNIDLTRFVPNPNPEEMENESDVEDEGNSTTATEEENDERENERRRRRKKRKEKYKRKLPPNDPRLGKAWRTPYLPPDLEIPRIYITPDGHILIMPKHQKPPFEVQDSFDSNVLRNTDFDRVATAARKLCFRLGYGGEPLFYDVDELLRDDREEYPCKFDVQGNVIEGREQEKDFYDEDLASNQRHNFPARIYLALENLRVDREEKEKRTRRRCPESEIIQEEENDFIDDEGASLIPSTSHS